MTAGLFAAFYALWCGAWWRLRGGAISNFGFGGGTQATRAVCCAAIALPLLLTTLAPWHALAVAPLLMAGLLLTQWEEFEDMGAGPATLELERPACWMRWLPRLIGLRPGTFWHDFVGMAQAGVVCLLPAAIGAAAAGRSPWWLLGAGALFAVAYAVPRWVALPAVPRFAAGREWAEVGAGMLVGGALLLTAGH